MPGSFPGRRGKRTGIEVVPEMVKRAREEAGLSQAQLAEPERTRAAIHLIETGKMRPSVTTLNLIARKTRKPISYFLASSEATPEQREAADHLERLVATQEFATAIAFGEPLLEQQLSREIEADVRFLLGRAYVRSQDGRNAHPHLSRAFELYELVGDQLQVADVLNQTACALYLMDDSRALAAACKALDACDGLRPPQSELTVRTLMVLGMIYARIQDWHRAAGCYERALKLVNAAPTIRSMGMLHDHLGMTYQRLGRFADALRHARKASRLYQGSADPTDLFRAEHNLGWILLMQGDLMAARPHLERALRLCDDRDLGNHFRGAALAALAELHIGLGEPGRAEVRLSEALEVVQNSNERTRQASVWRLHGRLHLAQHEYDQADVAFGKAAELFRSLDMPVDLFDVQVEHAEGLIRQGRVAEALELEREANTSARHAMLRIHGGGAEIVAAGWHG